MNKITKLYFNVMFSEAENILKATLVIPPELSLTELCVLRGTLLGAYKALLPYAKDLANFKDHEIAEQFYQTETSAKNVTLSCLEILPGDRNDPRDSR